MSVNLFFEARGEKSPLALPWILHSTYNRVKDERFPDSFCEVISSRGAYSWTYDHEVSDNPILWQLLVYNNYTESYPDMESWNHIFKTSIDFYINRDKLKDPTEGSLCYMTFELYMSRDFQPNCPNTKFHGIAGNHVFFNPI